MKMVKFRILAGLITVTALVTGNLVGCTTAPVSENAGDRELAQAASASARSLVMMISQQKGIAVKEVESAMIRELDQLFTSRSNSFLELFGSKKPTIQDLYTKDQSKLAQLLGKNFARSVKMSDGELATVQREVLASQSSAARTSGASESQASRLFGGNAVTKIDDQELRNLVQNAQRTLDPNHSAEVRTLAENLSQNAKTLDSSEARELLDLGKRVIQSELKIFEKSKGQIKVIAEGCGNSSDLVAMKNFSLVMAETEGAITASTKATEVGPMVSRSIAKVTESTAAEAVDRTCALSSGFGNCNYFQRHVCESAAKALKR